MRHIVALVIVVSVVAGLAGGLAVAQLSDRAGAAAPPPSATRVREQNLDGGGFVRVHEQGTANVAGTVNVGNLPAVQDVNVVSTPPAAPQGRLVELGTATVSGTGPDYVYPFVDVSDCGKITVVVTLDGPNPNAFVRITPEATLDGGTVFSAPASYVSEVRTGRTGSFVYKELRIRASPSVGEPHDITAWMWCEP